MWRSCLRLWDEGRRLLNRPRGGLIASVGPGPNPRLQARAYAPLTGIEFVVTQLKSMVLTLGLIDLRLTVEQAVLLSRLEEEYQIQKWGNIEWAHDYELQELRARTAAGALFVHLCSESTTVKHKLLRE
uniref:ATP synthase mitochondrial F1 complex assembly factor 2 n=1 Tax=Equus caballus TaxID=9796 RepID=A0A9L0TDU8_HORSE